jgi:hypothetical protein
VFLLSLGLGLGLSLVVMLSSVLFHNPLTVALPLVLVVAAVVFFARRAREARANAQETLRAKLEARQDAQRAGEVQRALEAKLSGLQGEQPGPATGFPGVEATFLNLSKLALAEGGLDAGEKKYLVRWGVKSGIPKERMKALFARARAEGGALSATHREDLTILACLALADGVLSTKELKHLLDFAKRLGLSAADLRQVIVEVESPPPAPA